MSYWGRSIEALDEIIDLIDNRCKILSGTLGAEDPTVQKLHSAKSTVVAVRDRVLAWQHEEQRGKKT